MTYGTDAAATHLSNAYRYVDIVEMQTNESSDEILTDTSKRDSSLDGTELAQVGKSRSLVDSIVTYVTCPIPITGSLVADQIDESPTERLSDE